MYPKMHSPVLVMSFFIVGFAVAYAHNIGTVSFSQEVNDIVCPNGWKCDDESTCCQLPNDDWGCCEFKGAQCCSDHLHCCPPGTECDVTGKRCQAKTTNQTIPAVRTQRHSSFPGLESRDKATVGMTCADHSVCPQLHSACCRTYAGRFSCCNYPNNVCCDGGTHCCPVGTVCDPIYFTCTTYPSDGAPLSFGWASIVIAPNYSPVKTSSVESKQEENEMMVKAPTATFACPDGKKCCLGQNGNYGQCIIDDPHAVCCGDGLHCCPQGSNCDVANGQCIYDKRQSQLVPWAAHVKSSKPDNNVICPDGEECPDGNTCCPLASGRMGCCRMPFAVCCSDGLHCCPYGTHCGSGGECVTSIQSSRIPWSSLVF